MLQKISLESICKHNGGLFAAAFDQEVMAVVADIKNRPNASASRSASLNVTFKPEVNDEGDLVNVEVQISFDHKCPKRSTGKISATTCQGGLAMNDLSQEDANQLTIDELGPQGAVANA